MKRKERGSLMSKKNWSENEKNMSVISQVKFSDVQI